MTDNQRDPDTKPTISGGAFAPDPPSKPDLTGVAQPSAEPPDPQEIGRRHQSVRSKGKRVLLLEYLERQGVLLDAAHSYFVRRSESKLSLSHAGEWILDNFYVVRQSLRQVREDLPESYYRELPFCGPGS